MAVWFPQKWGCQCCQVGLCSWLRCTAILFLPVADRSLAASLVLLLYLAFEVSVVVVHNARTRNTFGFAGQTGYVPKEDTMMRTLTVKENLIFSARSRVSRPACISSSSSSSSQGYIKLVEGVIDILGLYSIRHSAIGDENTRGISGGQRKRVNIGIELVVRDVPSTCICIYVCMHVCTVHALFLCSCVPQGMRALAVHLAAQLHFTPFVLQHQQAEPTVLLLDEPTSGLDATCASEVCSAMKALAKLGLTVVSVIHQPRFVRF